MTEPPKNLLAILKKYLIFRQIPEKLHLSFPFWKMYDGRFFSFLKDYFKIIFPLLKHFNPQPHIKRLGATVLFLLGAYFPHIFKTKQLYIFRWGTYAAQWSRSTIKVFIVPIFQFSITYTAFGNMSQSATPFICFFALSTPLSYHYKFIFLV